MNLKTLFAEWMNLPDNVTAEAFLIQKGINPKDVKVADSIKDWARAKKTLVTCGEGFTQETVGVVWDQIQEWRESQPNDDYKAAQLLKVNSQAFLAKNTIITKGADKKDVVHTLMSSKELKDVSQALSTAQLIQRNALGMQKGDVGVAAKEAARDGRSKNRKEIEWKLQKLKCWNNVVEMLDDYVPFVQVARYIQQERKEYLEVKEATLTNVIRKWYDEKHADFTKSNADRLPQRHLRMINAQSERVDPLDAANMLFAITVDRLMMDYDIEKQERRTLQSATNSLRLAKEIIVTINEIQSDQLQMRLRSENAGKGQVDLLDQMERVKRGYEEKYGKTAAIVALSDEGRRKVLNAINQLRRAANPHVIEMCREGDEAQKKNLQ